MVFPKACHPEGNLVPEWTNRGPVPSRTDLDPGTGTGGKGLSEDNRGSSPDLSLPGTGLRSELHLCS